ncbi:hypothetical protein Tco_0833347 [Tanacetum coccineum]
MDDSNITMEEYIRLEEEKARRQGQTFNWQTATYALSCKPTVSPLDNNENDFKISFDESDDEDYMVIFDENSFSCKIISVDNLKTDFEDETDKVNMPSSLLQEPTFGYIYGLDFFKVFENEFPAIAYNDLKSKSDPLIEPSIWHLYHLGIRGTHSSGMRGQELFTSHAWRRLSEITTPLVREFILEFLSTCRMRDMEMGLDVADTLYAEGRKSGARLSEGYFIGHLADYIGLVSDQGLRGLSVVTTSGPERQPDAAVGALGAAEDALAADDGAQADPAPVQAPQPSPPTPRTIQQRVSRIEEEVQEL